MAAEKIKYRGGCSRCAGDVTASPDRPLHGLCVNCGPVAIDQRRVGHGEWVGGSIGTEEIKYRCACFTCGGDVTVSRDHPLDGLCAKCGLVFVEVREIEGEYVEGFSVSSWLELQQGLAERAANPPPDDPDEIPF